jgi:AcrR family transcriptional regulator
MGKLIDPKRMKRARRAREERAARILAAAHTSFVRFPYSEVSLDTIGQQAGVKQGQASLAFRSREELFITVVRTALGKWFDEFETRLGGSDEDLTVEAASELIASTLAEHHELTRILGSLHTALEIHEDGLQVHEFYQWQYRRLLATAAMLAARIPGAERWDCFDALYRSLLVAAAVHPVSRPVGNLAVDLMAEENQIFALDLEDEVRRVASDSLKR